MNQWIPDLTHRHGSLHATLVEALEDAIRSGVFREGERLPSQRLLADQLSIHVNTVNRAFVEIARRGLVVGKLGVERLCCRRRARGRSPKCRSGE
jgi:GntR family transcriptional regulator